MNAPLKTAQGRLRSPREYPPRLGAILLATDLTFERDAARMIAPASALLHVARIPYENPTTAERLAAMAPDLARTAALLVPGAELAAVAFACTSASVTIGNASVASTVNEALPTVPVVTPTSAALAGFEALGARRVALLTPYSLEVTAAMADHFEREGLEIVTSACFALEDDREMARLDEASIVDAACALDAPGVEALFLSCTAMPGADVIDRIEARLDKPVVTSNQAVCWALLRMAGVSGRPEAFGRLFDRPLPVPHARGIAP